MRNASFVAEHQNFSSFCAAITEMVLQQTIINGIIDDEKKYECSDWVEDQFWSEVKFLTVTNAFASVNQRIDDLNQRLNQRIDDLNGTMGHIPDRIFKLLHDDNRDKVAALGKSSISANICGSMVTAHYVLYNKTVFGLSVAHTPCYRYAEAPPDYVKPCPNLDISLWIGCPPKNTFLLNITNSITQAKMGDIATAFGFASGRPRSWVGVITGQLGQNFEGVHFSPQAYEDENELIFQASQEFGMSGGGVLNGFGKCNTVITTLFSIFFSIIGI